MNIEELRLKTKNDREFAEAIIDECIFAFLVNYDGKFDPMGTKQIVLEHFGIYEDEQ